MLSLSNSPYIRKKGYLTKGKNLALRTKDKTKEISEACDYGPSVDKLVVNSLFISTCIALHSPQLKAYIT